MNPGARVQGWLELLVAELLHKYPTLQGAGQLRALIDHCCQLCPDPPTAITSRLLRGLLNVRPFPSALEIAGLLRNLSKEKLGMELVMMR